MFKNVKLLSLLLIFVFVSLFNMMDVAAIDCYYISNNVTKNAFPRAGEMHGSINGFDSDDEDFMPLLLSTGVYADPEHIDNLHSEQKVYKTEFLWGVGPQTWRGYEFQKYNGGYNSCPKYVLYVLRENLIDGDDEAVVTNNISEIQGFARWADGEDWGEDNFFVASSLNNDGTPITKEQYFGKIKVDFELPGEVIDILTCNDTLFGNPSDSATPSMAYLLSQLMLYIKIIVPILIIVLGSIDLFKAVVSSNEDEMKKAQKKFVKRIIAGVCVFFIPVLVNLLMNVLNNSLVVNGIEGFDPGFRFCDFNL